MTRNSRCSVVLLLSLIFTSVASISLGAPAVVRGTQAAAATADQNDALLAELEVALQQGVERGLAAVSLAVHREGRPPLSAAVGLANRERATPVTVRDRFRAYSLTKTFTAVLTLQLVDDGVLTLDDPVTKWLDDPAVDRIPFVDRMTIRHLLSHTSGVYDYYNGPNSTFPDDAFLGPNADWTKVWTPQELLAYADGARQAPAFAPGEGVGYSNTAYILLGLIVEAAGGQNVAAQMHARILGPLRLTNTFFAATEVVPGGTVEGYHLLGEDLVNVSAINLSWAWTQGGMVSTAEDLARFADALFGGDLLEPASRDAMLTFGPADEPGREWGLGLARLQTSDGALIGMNGSGPGFAARMYRLPDGSTAVLLTNTGLDDDTVDVIFAQVVALTRVDAGASS